MKFISLFLLPVACLAFASDDVIHLSKTSHFDEKKCQIIRSAYITDDKKVANFKMENNDSIPMTLLGKNSIKCYSFNYIPELSPYINLKVKNNNLYVVEMSGTASSGNWVKQRYNINVKNMSLIKK